MAQGPKQILFYGDSLVYGKKPSVPERYSESIRFSGILKSLLGADFELIEEGLRARNLFGENDFFPDRDGLKQFGPIFGSHVPLDLVILMLGTNNCNRTAEKDIIEFEAALDSYQQKIKEWCAQLSIQELPRLLIVAPPHIRGEELAKDAIAAKIFGPDAEERSKKLNGILGNYCQKNKIAFFDAATICETAINEGIHLDEENNRKLAEALAREIKSLF